MPTDSTSTASRTGATFGGRRRGCSRCPLGWRGPVGRVRRPTRTEISRMYALSACSRLRMNRPRHLSRGGTQALLGRHRTQPVQRPAPARTSTRRQSLRRHGRLTGEHPRHHHRPAQLLLRANPAGPQSGHSPTLGQVKIEHRCRVTATLTATRADPTIARRHSFVEPLAQQDPSRPSESGRMGLRIRRLHVRILPSALKRRFEWGSIEHRAATSLTTTSQLASQSKRDPGRTVAFGGADVTTLRCVPNALRRVTSARNPIPRPRNLQRVDHGPAPNSTHGSDGTDSGSAVTPTSATRHKCRILRLAHCGGHSGSSPVASFLYTAM